ncbi:hypothetical protein SteCoe_37883 [Stentor coeruleus]|uniref:Uncharacterized protein n=1 Tax=Stentor coeruleus TaxID=5963 RepID=A0A1R2AMI4_9CILI|nr:hypothetical protein SteCoe_37883 [Stentor coeruleus]
MFILAVLICQASSLLTFQIFNFGFAENDLMASFVLQDENNSPVQVEKVIYVQVVPMMSILFAHTLLFTRIGSITIIPSKLGSMYFMFSCEGCETYISSSISITYAEPSSVVLIPSTQNPNINEEISISYSNDHDFSFTIAYLLNNEEFNFRNVLTGLSSGVAYVTFFSCGVKDLMFDFEICMGWVGIIGGITIEVTSNIYNSIMFTSDTILFLGDFLELQVSVYTNIEMNTLLTGQCELYLSLSPSVPISGITTQVTTGGYATFSNLLINTVGTYKIIIEGCCQLLFESDEIVTITGVDSITVSLPSDYIQVSVETEITVSILGPNGSDLQLEAMIALVSSSKPMVGETTKSTTNGKAVFYITFETVGETTLSANSDHDLDTIDSMSKKVYIIESMCLETKNDVCVSCVPLANIIDGQCVCVDFSIEIILML